MDWEDKEESDKTWRHCQDYWNKIFKKRKRFSNLKPKQHGFEGAANINELSIEETECNDIKQRLQDVANAATADKEHIQQMSTTTEELLIIIKKQQSQIDTLVQTNSQLTANISKLTTNSNYRNNLNFNTKIKEKETTQEDINEAIKNGHGCTICGKHSNTRDCFELANNKSKRPDRWESIYK